MRKQNVFDSLNDVIRGAESSLVNLLSAIGPWLAPIAPAAMSYTHMIESLKFPIWVAVSVAIVVEILGLSAVSTIIAFWSYNRRRMAEYKRAPVTLALVAGVFYLLTVLSINVALDASRLFGINPASAEIFSRALLTMLSFPAAIIVAVRAQHHELVDQYEREKTEPKKAKEPVVEHGNNGNGNGSSPSENGRKKQFMEDLRSGELRRVLAEQGATTPKTIVTVIATAYGVSTRTAWRWWEEVKNANLAKQEIK